MKFPCRALETATALALATSSCAMFRFGEGLRSDIVDHAKIDTACLEIGEQIEAALQKAGGQKTIIGSSPYHTARPVMESALPGYTVIHAGHYRFPGIYELEDAYVEVVVAPSIRTFQGAVHGRVSFFINDSRGSQAETFPCAQPAE